MRKKTKINDIPSSTYGTKLIFQDEICDDLAVENSNVQFSSFLRLGIRDARFKGGTLSHSIFEDVYARKAKFISINFTGSVFRNCNFEKASFSSCTIKYCKFHNTQLPYLEIINCLPTEPNIREELARNLKMNFIGLGEKNIADKFLEIEIKAKEEKMWAIFTSKTDYYKEQFDWIDRFKNLVQYIISKLFGFLSGYGFKIRYVLFSFVILIIILSLLLYVSNSDLIFQNKSVSNLSLFQALKITFYEAIKYNQNEIYPFQKFGKFILLVSRLIGILYLGLISATIYRIIAR